MKGEYFSQPDITVSNNPRGFFSAYRSANVSVGSNTKLPFDVERWDFDGWFDTATGIYTPKLAGYYLINFTAMFSFASAFNFTLGVYKNGAEAAFGSHDYTAAAWSAAVSVGTVILYANGTTDNFGIYQTEGYTGTFLAGETKSRFEGYRLPIN